LPLLMLVTKRGNGEIRKQEMYIDWNLCERSGSDTFPQKAMSIQRFLSLNLPALPKSINPEGFPCGGYAGQAILILTLTNESKTCSLYMAWVVT